MTGTPLLLVLLGVCIPLALIRGMSRHRSRSR